MENCRSRRPFIPGGCHPGREALVAIDNYHNSVTDEVAFLRQENHDMRIRLSKLNEIESRIDNLMMRDEHNIHELELLRGTLRQKAGEIEELRHCMGLEKHSFSQNQAALRHEIQGLLSKIAWLNRDRQQADILAEKQFQELRAVTAREVQTARGEVSHTQQQAQIHIGRLEDTIRTLTVQIQQKDREHGSYRLRMMDELQQLACRNDQLTRDNCCLNGQNANLRVDLSGIISESQQLKQAHQVLTVEKLRSDQQRTQLLLDIKDAEKQLGTSIRGMRSLEEQLLEKDSELRRISQINQQFSVNCEQMESQLRKKNRLLDEYHSELSKQEDLNRQQIAELSAKLMDSEDAKEQAHFQITSLTEKAKVLQYQTDAKTVQIRDLLYGIERLEQKIITFETKCRSLQSDNTVSAERISKLGQQWEMSNHEIRSLQEKSLLKETQIQELEDLLQIQRTARLIRDKQIQEFKRTVVNPQHISRKYEEQMLRMVRNFEEEKVIMEERFGQQKTRLRQLFQYELKDTQDLFQRKLRVLEEQLHH